MGGGSSVSKFMLAAIAVAMVAIAAFYFRPIEAATNMGGMTVSSPATIVADNANYAVSPKPVPQQTSNIRRP